MGDAPASFRAALARLSELWAVACDDQQAEALARFGTLLLTWNAHINLTGASSLDALAAEHLPDSFALASRFDPVEPARAVDVGSGGGLPALPLALLRPALTLRLVEPIAKKAAFLRTATRELGLRERVTVHVGRVEALAATGFDAAMSRATFAPEAWAAVGAKLVHPGGRVFLLAAVPATALAPPPPLVETFRRQYLDDRRALVELLLPA
jgi:16S rRNA (guanine(527)-N(7))-methyltransferase RsmG